MLTRTFIHLPQVGEATERKLWRLGLHDWDSGRACVAEGKVKGALADRLAEGLEASQDRLATRDASYFARALLPRDHWRAWPEFGDQVAFVDIETTGCDHWSAITVIGIWDGVEVRQYVKGHNLEEAKDDLASFPLLVTFNGACFDLPFIYRELGPLAREPLHIDLRFALKRVGYGGGLKSVEHQLGLSRSDETTGLDGMDAVRLWQEYRSGRQASLDLLLAYNAEDIINLEPLAQTAYELLRQAARHPADVSAP